MKKELGSEYNSSSETPPDLARGGIIKRFPSGSKVRSKSSPQESGPQTVHRGQLSIVFTESVDSLCKIQFFRDQRKGRHLRIDPLFQNWYNTALIRPVAHGLFEILWARPGVGTVFRHVASEARPWVSHIIPFSAFIPLKMYYTYFSEFALPRVSSYHAIAVAVEVEEERLR